MRRRRLRLRLIGAGLTAAAVLTAAAAAAAERHPARIAESWALAGTPLTDRVGPAPHRVIDWLHVDNAAQGWPERPRAVTPSAALTADLRRAIEDLPPEVVRLVADRLAGLFFVEELGGSAYTETVLDRHGRPVGAFIVFDAGALDRTANAWATWKERSPFRESGEVTIEATIAEPADDTRARALSFILLHELGHVVSVGRDLHPDWSLPPPRRLGRWPFAALDWRRGDDGRWASRYDEAWKGRAKLRYYAPVETALPATEAIEAWVRLAATGFPTLYAATNPYDDFAESFATFVHVERLGRPWQVRLTTPTGVRVVEACWDEPRCGPRRRLLEALLGGR